MRFQAYDTGGQPLSLRTARPDCASEACCRQTKITYGSRIGILRGSARPWSENLCCSRPLLSTIIIACYRVLLLQFLLITRL